MKFYPENYAVELTVPFTDLNGDAVTPSAVRAVLYDGEDEQVVDLGGLPFSNGDTQKVVAIAAAFNVLAVGELSAARILRVELEVPAGIIRRSFSYIIEGEFRLEVANNTFMSFEAAQMLARDVPNLGGWSLAEDESRQAALIEAHARLCRIPMKYSLPVADDNAWDQACATEMVMLPADWQALTAEGFRELPTGFKKALRQAQLAEANELLEGDEVGKRQRMGIISETIGESSMMLRGGQLQIGISTNTLSYLRGFIYYNMRITRV